MIKEAWKRGVVCWVEVVQLVVLACLILIAIIK